MNLSRLTFFAWLAGSAALHSQVPVPVFPYGSDWHYLDDGKAPPSEWNSSQFDSSHWKSGPGQLGYGDGDEATLLKPNQIAYFFRSEFQIPDPDVIKTLDASVLFDDAAIIYLNGEEVFRTELMPDTQVDHTTTARKPSRENHKTNFGIHLAKVPLKTGTNTIAVQVHNHSRGSSDISFDLKLSAVTTMENLHPLTKDRPQQVSGRVGAKQFFYFDIPDDAMNLRVTLQGGTGNADLYGSKGDPFGWNGYEVSSAGPSNSEEIRIHSPSAGSYTVLVYGADIFYRARLTLEYETDGSR